MTFNSEKVIKSCIDSLSSDVRFNDIELVIVDNASKDSTISIIESLKIRANIVKNSANLGFAKAVNVGAKHAKGDVYVLLNPDTIASSISIHELAGKVRMNPDVVMAPNISHPTDRLHIISAGRFPTIARMFLHYSGISRLSTASFLEGHYLFPDQISGEREVEWATGACLAIHRSVWNQLGGLTERWFMYAEDIEFCWRLSKNGFTVKLIPEIKILHDVGTGTSEPASMRPDWVTNLFRFYRDDLSSSRVSAIAWKFTVAAGLLSRSSVYRFRSLRSHENAMWRHESKRFLSFAKALLAAR